MENEAKTFTYTGEKLGRTNRVKITKLYNTIWGQDGAVFGSFLFHFDAAGKCYVFDVKSGRRLSDFRVDRYDDLKIHSNAVCFGSEYFEKGDEFPLLYTNVYNSYQACKDRFEGTCGVYRIRRDGVSFSASLVQVIRVGFTEDLETWKSLPGNGDVRPYGNFTVDAKTGTLWAFTMRDKEKVTRFFSFALPASGDGVFDEKYGCNVITLEKSGITDCFDAPYSYFLQGACFDNGLIYSTEGFSNSTSAPPAMRIIDVKAHAQKAFLDFQSWGLTVEPEFVSVYDGVIYFANACSEVYNLEFI